MYLSTARDQSPRDFQRPRKLELVEQRVELRDGLVAQSQRSRRPPRSRAAACEGYGTSPLK